MASEPDLNVSSAADEGRAAATMTMAFSNDPIARWVFHDANVYLTYMPPLVNAFGGAAFEHGSADTIDDYGGVALWLPPGIAADEEAMGALVAEAVPAAEHDEVFGFMGQMDEFHPKEPHWYLPLIGVDVTKQGRGFGGALLAHALERCDRDGLPAYLEATSARSKALYQRHGFQEVGVIQEGNSPDLYPMLRPAR